VILDMIPHLIPRNPEHLIPLHPQRRRKTEMIARRDPDTEWQDIYRQLVLWEFPVETRGGFQVAFYRPEAVPRMAVVLAGTGHIQANPGRRTLDTGIIILELIHGGFDSDRGQKMVRLLKALHARPDIYQEDLTYVLCSLMVVPTRFIERLGWRPILDVERVATWRFWCELGRRIGIDDLPDGYVDAEARFDLYEAENLAPSPEGRQLTGLIVKAFEGWMPGLLKPYLAEITSSLIDDAKFSDALGLPPARQRITLALNALYRVRRVRQRVSPPGHEPGFVPGQSVADIYPDGYSLDQLGPPYQRVS
jgi:hypothetical protein